MKLITILEHFNGAERSVDWYDNDTGELIRSYPEWVTAAMSGTIMSEQHRLRGIKIPTELHESQLWC